MSVAITCRNKPQNQHSLCWCQHCARHLPLPAAINLETSTGPAVPTLRLPLAAACRNQPPNPQDKHCHKRHPMLRGGSVGDVNLHAFKPCLALSCCLSQHKCDRHKPQQPSSKSKHPVEATGMALHQPQANELLLLPWVTHMNALQDV